MASARPATDLGARASAHVVGVYTATSEAFPLVRRTSVLVTPGLGLDGDRYSTRTGFWTDDRVSRDVTLVATETIDSLAATLGQPVQPSDLRRNVVTRGVDLNDLVGARFWVGDVALEGTSLCQPCRHLQQVTGLPLLAPLVHRGGLRANALTIGHIQPGDGIRLATEEFGVGVVVRRGGQYLLGLRAGSSEAGTWSTPGGRLGSGEGVPAAALRELAEETGLVGRAPRAVVTASSEVDGAAWRSTFVAVEVDVEARPVRREPTLRADWGWFSVGELPRALSASTRLLFGAGL